jgi:hypothetical protein
MIGTLTELNAAEGDTFAHVEWRDGSKDMARSATYEIRECPVRGVIAQGVENPSSWYRLLGLSKFRLISRAGEEKRDG